MKNQQQKQTQPSKLKPTKRIENHRKPPPVTTTTTTTATTTTSTSNPKNKNIKFPIGFEVEVTSDEEGFKGAWYSAIVTQEPSLSLLKQENKVYVEYKTLLSDEKKNTLLKEYVDIEFVRPKPPLNDEKIESFRVNDVVDAFYQDGWWCGVVSELIEQDNKYLVSFASPPDQILFNFCDLRVHRDWVHGNWVLPQLQSMRESKFIPGTTVEVNIEPDNSCDVWFPATFLNQVANDSFLVEYKESKEAELQKVAVDSLHIRPSPPRSSEKSFNLLEKVDAFHESRWLSGVVTKILAHGRYIVYFKRTKKEKELSHPDLRLHMEWNNGKWIQSSEETPMKSNSEKRSNLAAYGGNKEKICAPAEGSYAVENNVSSEKTSTTNLRSGQKELQVSGNENSKHSSTTPSNKRVKQTSANGDVSRSRRPRRMNEEPASDVGLSPERCKLKMKHVETSNHEMPADLDSPSSGHGVQSDLKQGEDSNQQSDQTNVKNDNVKLSTSRKRGRPLKLRHAVSGDALGEAAAETPRKIDLAKQACGPIVMGLTHTGKIIDSLGDTSNLDLKLEHKESVEDEDKNMDGQKGIVSNGSEKSKEGEVTNVKRKRGQPFKEVLRVGSPKKNTEEPRRKEKKYDPSDAKDDEKDSPIHEVAMPIAGTSNSVPDSRIMPVNKTDDQMKRVSGLCRHSMRSTSRKQIRKRKVPTVSAMHDLNESVKSIIVKKGKKQKSSKLADSQSEADAVDNLRTRAIEDLGNGVDRAVGRTSSNGSDDDKPLSAWFEGAVSPLAIDYRGVSAFGTTGPSNWSAERAEIKTALVGQVKDLDQIGSTSVEIVGQSLDQNGSGKSKEIAIQSQITAIVPSEEQDLPFAKTSLIWELLESMEILKQIPQKPHFRSLYNCKEECREGLAIGSMVTFTSLVDRMSNSRFSDSRSNLDGSLETLVDLENLGFNVSPVREQLNKLISLKCKYEQAENTAKEIENQITELDFEKSTINGELTEIDKKIAELMEKRAVVLSKKERKEAEIALLQTSIAAVKDTLDTAEKEYENITSSLW